MRGTCVVLICTYVVLICTYAVLICTYEVLMLLMGYTLVSLRPEAHCAEHVYSVSCSVYRFALCAEHAIAARCAEHIMVFIDRRFAQITMACAEK